MSLNGMNQKEKRLYLIKRLMEENPGYRDLEVLVQEHDNISLIRLNLDQAVVPESLGDRAVGINANMAQSIKDIVKMALL